MKKYHCFEIVCENGFAAKFAISGTHSLYELAATCIEAIGFDFDHAFEFFSPPGDPYKAKVKCSLFADMGEEVEPDGGLSVEMTTIEGVFSPGSKFGLLFDYGDFWLFEVRCLEVKETKRCNRFIRITDREGKPPEQYPDWEE